MMKLAWLCWNHGDDPDGEPAKIEFAEPPRGYYALVVPIVYARLG